MLTEADVRKGLEAVDWLPIDNLILEGKLIKAISVLREQSGIGLKNCVGIGDERKNYLTNNLSEDNFFKSVLNRLEFLEPGSLFS